MGLTLNTLHATSQDYNSKDIECLEEMKNNNLQNTLNWTDNDYDSWQGVTWNSSTPRRIVGLDVSQSSLNTLDISYLTELNWLICKENKISALTGLSELKKLTTLDCSFNNLTSLQGLGDLISLKILYCNDNKLTNLNDLDKLTNLTDIDCSHNSILSLPDFNQLQGLKSLNCSVNQLSNLPSGIDQLKKLKILHCSSNKISKLPEIEQLSELTWLDCGDNYITSLPNLSNLKNLETLWCHSNQLTTLPELIKLTNLKWLNCGDNQLISMPDLYSLKNLEVLWCYSNKLTKLPDLTYLINLEWLYCGNNNLSTDKLYKINKLTQLSCINNHFCLSDLNFLSKVMDEKLAGDQYDVFKTEEISAGSVIDFSSQAYFNQQPTEFKVTKNNQDAVEDEDYSINNGVISFLTSGKYIVEMSNPSIYDDIGIIKVFTTPITVQSTSTKGNQIQDPIVLIYPNPVERDLFINSISEILDINIFDIDGRMVYKGITNKISVANWNKGIYLAHIKTSAGNIVQKIIKKSM